MLLLLLPRPLPHRAFPAHNRRAAAPVALDLLAADPLLVLPAAAVVAMALALGRPAGTEEDGLERAGFSARSGLPSPPAAPPPPTTPQPKPLTPEGTSLRKLLQEDELEEFVSSWAALLKTLSESASAPPGTTLEARVAEVKGKENGRRVLVDALNLAVAYSFQSQALELLASSAAIAPGAELPPDAASLVRVSQQFPGQSARQVRAFVTEASPSNDANLRGRVDRLQAARLYLGHVQFGYFLSQIFRGQEGLDDETVLTAQEAAAIKARIEQVRARLGSARLA